MGTFVVGETENLEAPSTPPRQKTPEPQEAVSPAKVDRVNSDSNMRVRHVFKDGYWVQEPYKTAAQGQPVGQSAACSPIPSGTSQIPFFSSYSNDNSLLGSLSCTDVLNGLEHGSFKDRSPFSVGKPHASPLGKQEMYQPSPLSLNESKSKIPKPATAPCPTRTNHQQDLYASTDLALCCTQQEQNLVEDFVDLRDASSIAWADVHKTLSSSLSAKRVGDLRRSIKSGTKSPPGEKAGPFFTGSGLAIRGLFGEDRGSAQNESSFEKSIGMQCQSAERTSNHGTSSSYGGSSFRSSIDKENIQDLGQSSTNFGSSHSFALSEWAKNCATRYPDDALRMSEEDWKGVKRMECEEDLQAERHVLYQTIPEACNVEDAQSDVHTSGVSMETPCETKAGKRELLLGGATCILLLLSLGCYVLTRQTGQPSKRGRLRLSEKYPSITVCSPIAALQYSCLVDPLVLGTDESWDTCETEAQKVLGFKKCPAFSNSKSTEKLSSRPSTFSFLGSWGTFAFLKLSTALVLFLSCTCACLSRACTTKQSSRKRKPRR